MAAFYKNRVFQIVIALITAGMDFFHLGLVYPIFAEMVASPELGWAADSWQRSMLYAILIGAFPFAQCIGSPILGKMSDVYGRRQLLFYSVAGSALGMAVCAFGVLFILPWVIIGGRLLGGLMGANLSLAYAAIVDMSTEKTKVKNLSLIPLTTSIGFVMGPLLVGLLEINPAIAALGASIPLWIATLLSMCNWGLLWLFEDSSTATKKETKERSILLQNKRLAIPLLVAFLMISANFLLVQYIGPYAINVLNGDLSTVSWLYVNLCVAVSIGHLALTRTLASVASPKSILPWSLVALACSLIVLGNMSTLLGLHIIIAIAMLCCAVAYTNVFAYLSDQVSPNQQGEIMGLGVSTQCLAEWVPPIAVGMFTMQYPALPMFVGAIGSLLGVSILLVCKKKMTKEEFYKTISF